jgi:E3 ubiquitin-protein ligase TRIP12
MGIFPLGYEYQPDIIENFFEIVAEMSSREQGLFIKFLTGSHRLPIGGLTGLKTKFKLRKKVESDDESLPTSSTCVGMLKLPPYSSKEVMKENLLKAIEEGQSFFGFS